MVFEHIIKLEFNEDYLETSTLVNNHGSKKKSQGNQKIFELNENNNIANHYL